MFRFVLLVWCLALPASARAQDFQKQADDATWRWNAEQANVLYSVVAARCGYQIELVRPKEALGSNLTLRFVQGDKVALSFPAHMFTTFVVDDDIVYRAVYNPSATGCAIVAYDLKAGKELWKSNLRGIGPIAHTAYSNRVMVELVPGALRVWGKEAAGRYLEYVDLKTGKTLANRVFKD